jgi:predicted RecB family endonuclease
MISDENASIIFGNVYDEILEVYEIDIVATEMGDKTSD